jgi:hypothetical protein
MAGERENIEIPNDMLQACAKAVADKMYNTPALIGWLMDRCKDIAKVVLCAADAPRLIRERDEAKEANSTMIDQLNAILAREGHGSGPLAIRLGNLIAERDALAAQNVVMRNVCEASNALLDALRRLRNAMGSCYDNAERERVLEEAQQAESWLDETLSKL